MKKQWIVIAVFLLLLSTVISPYRMFAEDSILLEESDVNEKNVEGEADETNLKAAENDTERNIDEKEDEFSRDILVNEEKVQEEGDKKVQEANMDIPKDNTKNNVKEEAIREFSKAYTTEFLKNIELHTTSNFDDNITVNADGSTVIHRWETMGVKYYWELPNDTVKEGDTLTMSLPEGLDFKSNKTVDLDGYGTAIINAETDTFTITFSKLVEEEENITFHLEGLVAIDSVHFNKNEKITIKFPSSSGTYDFSFELTGNGTDPKEELNKYSWQYDDKNDAINWTVRVNLAGSHVDGKTMSQAKLYDELGPGHIIMRDSFEIYKVKFEYLPGALNPTEVPGGKIQLSEAEVDKILTIIDDRRYEINFGDISETYVIDYKTKYSDINNILREKVSNLATLNYAGQEISDPADYEYDWASGGASGNKKPSIILSKVDEKGDNITSNPATFSLYKEDGTLIKEGLKTDSNGFVTYDGLASGGYYFIETEAPTGYELNEDAVKFTLIAGEPAKVVQKINKKMDETGTGTAELIKVDADDNTRLEIAVFKLMQGETIIYDNLKTGKDGKINVKDLAPGTYQFIETSAPEGYKLDETPHEVTVVAGETATITITNEKEVTPEPEPETGAVVLTKLDAANPSIQLAGAVFELRTKEGMLLKDDLTTDKNGKFVVNELPVGEYQFIEISPPTDYVKDATPVYFTIEAGQTKATQVEKFNEKQPEPQLGVIELTKVEKDTSTTLEDAVFTLFKGDAVVKEGLITDANGKIKVKDLAPGAYTFVETKAPKDYVLNATPHTVTVETGKTATITITNEKEKVPTPEPQREKGSIELTKVSSANTTVALANAVFELRAKDGTVIQSKLTTDASGKIVVKDLPVGEYQFVETAAPNGYLLDSRPQAVTVKTDETATITVTNTPRPVIIIPDPQPLRGSVELLKVDAANARTVLADAVFELRTKDGAVVRNDLKTDANGKITVTSLTPGEYVFIETAAPTGYVLDATPQSVTVKTGETATITVTNKKTSYSIEVVKVDAISKAAIQGATFTLYKKDGTSWTEVTGAVNVATDDEGKVVFENLQQGEYKAVETAAAPGYIEESAETGTLTIDGTMDVVSATVENKPYVNVELLKLDSETDAVLADAIFQLYEQNEEDVFVPVIGGLFVTGEDGQAVIERLQAGKYRLVETEAPEGYEKLTAPIDFEITEAHLSKPGSLVLLAPIPNEKLVVTPGPDPEPNPEPTPEPEPNPEPTPEPTPGPNPQTPPGTGTTPNTETRPPGTTTNPSTTTPGTTTTRPLTQTTTGSTTRPTTITPSTVAAKPTATNNTVQQQKLPQTSVSSSMWTTLFGSLLIAGASTLLVARRKRT